MKMDKKVVVASGASSGIGLVIPTRRIRDCQTITVDGGTGTVTITN
jgi:NADP-dependent 3-hydroxy acid dehydrogenase YdfG